MTLTPAADPDNVVESRLLGHGAVRFRRAAWADLPTMYHVVNALTELPVIEPRGGRVQHSRGGKPYLDQKVLL